MGGYGKIIALNGAMAIVQLGYAVIGLLGNNFLMGPLKMSDTMVTGLNAIGPVAGLLVQPMIGALSDVCHSRFGRRRPFIFAGSMITAVSFLCYTLGTFDIFSLAVQRFFGITALIFLNVGLNVILGPYRALTQEALPPELIDKGNAFASIVLGFIFMLLNLGFFLLCHFLYHGNADPGQIAQDPIFLLIFRYSTAASAVLSVLFAIPVAVAVHEVPLPRDSDGRSLLEDDGSHRRSSRGAVREVFYQMWHGLISMPRGMIVLWTAFLFCWSGFFPYQMFLAAAGCLGLYLGAFVTFTTNFSSFCFSFLIPKLSGKTGQPLWFVTQVLVTLSFFAYVFDTDLSQVRSFGVFFSEHWWIFICALVVGLNQASMNSIPFAMIGKGIAAPMPNGMACSILNVAVVLGQGIALLFQMIFYQFLDSFRTPFVICLVFSSICILIIGLIDTRSMGRIQSTDEDDELGDKEAE